MPTFTTPRIPFGAIHIRAFQAYFIYIHLPYAPNSIRGYSHSSLSGLFYLNPPTLYPEFHSGLITFKPFRLIFTITSTSTPRIQFWANHIQAFQACIVYAPLKHTPNFIRGYSHLSLSGLFYLESQACKA